MTDEVKICALVVTFNRAELLLQCLNAILQQSVLPHEIIIVDNHSDQNTIQALLAKTYIAELSTAFISSGGVSTTLFKLPTGATVKIHYYRLDANYGGAGGFNCGMRYFYEQTNSDQVWLMDDDCQPEKHALEELVKAYSYLVVHANKPQVGYVCSQVKWLDGTACKLANPIIDNLGLGYFNVNSPCVRVKSCAFVSVMFSREIVATCGLPIKEFFIWHDDMEYTMRIVKYGFSGFITLDSIVYHHTLKNLCVDLNQVNADNLYKFKFGVRNELITYRLIRGKFPLVPLLKLLRNIIIAKITLRYKYVLLASLVTGLTTKFPIEYFSDDITN